MTFDEMKAEFGKHEDEYIKFENIENKRSTRPDIHAFILLNELVPGTRDMICAAEHDEFYLDPDLDELAKAISPQQVLELVRCGVRMDADCGGLAMFA